MKGGYRAYRRQGTDRFVTCCDMCQRTLVLAIVSAMHTEWMMVAHHNFTLSSSCNASVCTRVRMRSDGLLMSNVTRSSLTYEDFE
jgi:hypothetical protein